MDSRNNAPHGGRRMDAQRIAKILIYVVGGSDHHATTQPTNADT